MKNTPAQKTAIETIYGPLVILAGAGSGKTKVITERAIYMMEKGIPSSEILVLTFSNKAAKEMKERVASNLKEGQRSPLMSTFHSFCLRLLSQHIESDPSNGRTVAFSMADEEISTKIIKKMITQEMKDDGWKADTTKSIISNLKNAFIASESVPQTLIQIKEYVHKKRSQNKPAAIFTGGVKTLDDLELLSEIYVAYNLELKKNNLLDFDDLINYTVSVLEYNSDLRDYYHNKFKFLMVDEFQDTNYSQLKMLKLLLSSDNNIMVVGDDFQSIYGWRGAEIDFILDFENMYNNVKLINLNMNFRSTPQIVDTANKLIEFASIKHDKKEALTAFNPQTGNLTVKKFRNSFGESAYLAEKVKNLLKFNDPSDIVILYRMKMIGKPLEKEFIKRNIPYKFHNGRSLLQKKSITEILSVLKFMVNESNSISLYHAFVSAKVFSEKKMEEISKTLSPIELLQLSTKEISEKIKLTSAQSGKLNNFRSFYSHLSDLAKSNEYEMDDVVTYFKVSHPIVSSMNETFLTTKSEATKDKISAAREDFSILFSLMADFDTIYSFIEHISLDENIDTEDQAEIPRVMLMTVHNSKGLEFKHVFLPGWNEGIIPSERSLADITQLEEERRLAYVAITRAKEFVHISYPEERFYKKQKPSSFLKEMDLI